MGTTEQLTCSFTFKITSLKLEEIVLFFSCNFKQPNNCEVVSSLSSVLYKPLQLFDSTLVPILKKIKKKKKKKTSSRMKKENIDE